MCWITCLVLVLAGLQGCGPEPQGEVVIYSATDREFSAPILGAFHRAEDKRITPAPQYDFGPRVEDGLFNRILAEADAPVADVLWNNEILQTVRLQKAGQLQRRAWKVGADWPPSMLASDGTWCGFAARARVLIVNTNKLRDPQQWPVSVDDLADPGWKDQCALARPFSGTPATHAAVLEVERGSEAAESFFRKVADNAIVLPDNKQVAVAVAEGKAAWGLTDSDEAIGQRDAGRPVAIVFPDQAPGQLGTLRIPNTIAIVKNGPNPAAAAVLVDFLARPDTEDRLAMGPSSQIPVSHSAEVRPHVLPAEPVRWLEPDFEAAADVWDELVPKLRAIFSRLDTP